MPDTPEPPTGGSKGSSFGAILKSPIGKSGPPVGIVVVVGVVALVLYLKHKQGTTPAATTNPNVTTGGGAPYATTGNVYINNNGTAPAPGTIATQGGNPPHLPGPVTPPKKTPAPTKSKSTWYTVKRGDNLTKIASEYKNSAGKTLTAAQLYSYNTTGGHRSASSEKTIAKRGKNLIYSGESFIIPAGYTKK